MTEGFGLWGGGGGVVSIGGECGFKLGGEGGDVVFGLFPDYDFLSGFFRDDVKVLFIVILGCFLLFSFCAVQLVGSTTSSSITWTMFFALGIKDNVTSVLGDGKVAE